MGWGGHEFAPFWFAPRICRQTRSLDPHFRPLNVQNPSMAGISLANYNYFLHWI